MQYSLSRLAGIFFGLTSLFFSAVAFAAPQIIFKPLGRHKVHLALTAMPKAVADEVNALIAKQPDLYRVIVNQVQDHYVIYLLSGKYWLITKVRVDLDKQRNLRQVTDNYQWDDSEKKLIAADVVEPTCPDPSVEFVAISAYPGVGEVNQAIADVTLAARQKYKTMTMVSADADAQTYLNWLSCPNLKGFYSIGHGDNQEIEVGHEELVSVIDFMDAAFINKFQKMTLVLNSCQVFNIPFGSQLLFGNALTKNDYDMNPGPNTYEFLGGYANLLIYYSEPVSACFMIKAMAGAAMDYSTLKACVGNNNIYLQDYALAYPGKYFNQ